MRQERDFMANGDRYHFDFGECTASNGFAQVDTSQDASYFGIWTNPFDFITISFIEGDIIRDIAENAEEYAAFLRKMRASYEEMETPIIGIDPMLNDELEQRFKELELTDLLHKSYRWNTGATSGDTSPDSIKSD